MSKAADTVVTREQMWRAAELISASEGRQGASAEQDLAIIAGAFPRDVAISILSRFTALDYLARTDDRLRTFGWETGSPLLPAPEWREPILAAAATAPLIDQNGELVFDSDAFLAAVLRHAKELGRA